MSENYSVDEMLAVCMARQIQDEEIAVIGLATPLASAACFLAKATHAPNSTVIYDGTAGAELHDIAMSMLYPDKLRELTYGFVSHMNVLDMIHRGRITLQFISPAQIDMYGNVNVSLIGDHYKPKVRFPGSLALADVMVLMGRIVVYMTRHEKRAFVEKVDFISGAGHLEQGQWRRRMKIRGAGPVAVVTNLAVMGFNEEAKRMALESVHPGVDVSEVVENTGFELLIPKEVPVTSPPTEEELRGLREKIDPHGVRKMEFREFRQEVTAKLASLKG